MIADHGNAANNAWKDAKVIEIVRLSLQFSDADQMWQFSPAGPQGTHLTLTMQAVRIFKMIIQSTSTQSHHPQRGSILIMQWL